MLHPQEDWLRRASQPPPGQKLKLPVAIVKNNERRAQYEATGTIFHWTPGVATPPLVLEDHDDHERQRQEIYCLFGVRPKNERRYSDNNVPTPQSYFSEKTANDAAVAKIAKPV